LELKKINGKIIKAGGLENFTPPAIIHSICNSSADKTKSFQIGLST
jgi:hypothetical protein